jgi:hypothetical protein
MSSDSETSNPANDPELVKAYLKISEQARQNKGIQSTYYTDIDQENQKKLEALSPLDEFLIVFPPDYDPQTWELKADGYEKLFMRRKVNRKLYWVIESMASEILKEKDPQEREKKVDRRYRYMSKLFLEEKDTHKPMTDQDFDRADWEQLKYILLSCTHAFVHGRLPLARRSGIA